MNFTFNGNTPDNITFNNYEVLVVKWNGTTVWEKTTDFSNQYFTFVAKGSGTFAFSGSTTANTISYSLNNGAWSTPSTSVSLNVSSGNKVRWKGSMTPDTANNAGIGTFSASTASFDAQGNAMSLLFGDNYQGQTSLSGKNYAFADLMVDTNVVNAENMILLAETLSNACYLRLFTRCSSLTKAPTLSSMTLAASCYSYMFSGCTSLTVAPELPATTVQNYVYSNMFRGCTSLTTASELQAPASAQGCYRYMYYGCTNLTTAPSAISASTMGISACTCMFQGCSKLTTPPDLLVDTLATASFYRMFYGCSRLNYIKFLATDISATNGLYQWVSGVSATGLFVKAASMTSIPVNSVNGIPNGWTVQDDVTPSQYYMHYKSSTHSVINFDTANVWPEYYPDYVHPFTEFGLTANTYDSANDIGTLEFTYPVTSLTSENDYGAMAEPYGSIFTVNGGEPSYDLVEVEIPATVELIDGRIFGIYDFGSSMCNTGVTAVTFETSSSLMEIRGDCFAGTSISSIEFPEGLKKVGRGVIADHFVSWQSIDFPSTLESFDDQFCIYNLNKATLPYITFRSTTPPTLASNAILNCYGTSSNRGTLFVPSTTSSAYRSAYTNTSNQNFYRWTVTEM